MVVILIMKATQVDRHAITATAKIATEKYQYFKEE